jgi:hypothetical protein
MSSGVERLKSAEKHGTEQVTNEDLEDKGIAPDRSAN